MLSYSSSLSVVLYIVNNSDWVRVTVQSDNAWQRTEFVKRLVVLVTTYWTMMLWATTAALWTGRWGRFVDLSKVRSGKSRVSKILYVYANSNECKTEVFRSAPNIEIRAFSKKAGSSKRCPVDKTNGTQAFHQQEPNNPEYFASLSPPKPMEICWWWCCRRTWLVLAWTAAGLLSKGWAKKSIATLS